MFETLEAIRKYPLEAKRRLVGIVTAVLLTPVFIAWLIWLVSYVPEAFTQVEVASTPGESVPEILPPYSN